MIIQAVSPQKAVLMWEHIAPHLDKAVRLSPEVISMDDVYEGVASGDYLVWLAIDEEEKQIVAAFTTRVAEYPQAKALVVDFVGGKRMKEWAGLAVSEVRKQAALNNCRWIEGYGRRAWERWVRNYGAKQAYVAYKMEL